MNRNSINKKVFYLTFNDAPGGIFQSQVIDVIKLYRKQDIDAKLIAFISIRGFFKQRSKIKNLLSQSIVLPAFPKLKYWHLNSFWFYFLSISQSSIVIARNIIACNLALKTLSKKCEIIYDGRGAILAEQDEYNVYGDTGIENQIEKLERKSVLNSHKRIAVSHKLVEYWKSYYSYSGNEHEVIPCTLSLDFSHKINSKRNINLKEELNIQDNELVFVYSGSIAEWQSFDKIGNILKIILVQNDSNKLIFLAKKHTLIEELISEFPGRVVQRYVPHNEVVDYLDLCDYGLLLREKSITNQVASPVKCAEYLSRGLKVLITPEIGDYSDQIEENELGFVVDLDQDLPFLKKGNKQHQIAYSNINLNKNAQVIIDKYLKIIHN